MTSLDRLPAELARSDRAGRASLGIGVLRLLWTVVPLFGLGLAAETATTISLGLGALAVALGTVGLYRHWKGHATNGWTSAWGMVLGFVFGLAPTVFLILAFASAG